MTRRQKQVDVLVQLAQLQADLSKAKLAQPKAQISGLQGRIRELSQKPLDTLPPAMIERHLKWQVGEVARHQAAVARLTAGMEALLKDASTTEARYQVIKQLQRKGGV